MSTLLILGNTDQYFPLSFPNKAPKQILVLPFPLLEHKVTSEV